MKLFWTFIHAFDCVSCQQERHEREIEKKKKISKWSSFLFCLELNQIQRDDWIGPKPFNQLNYDETFIETMYFVWCIDFRSCLSNWPLCQWPAINFDNANFSNFSITTDRKFKIHNIWIITKFRPRRHRSIDQWFRNGWKKIYQAVRQKCCPMNCFSIMTDTINLFCMNTIWLVRISRLHSKTCNYCQIFIFKHQISKFVRSHALYQLIIDSYQKLYSSN